MDYNHFISIVNNLNNKYNNFVKKIEEVNSSYDSTILSKKNERNLNEKKLLDKLKSDKQRFESIRNSKLDSERNNYLNLLNSFSDENLALDEMIAQIPTKIIKQIDLQSINKFNSRPDINVIKLHYEKTIEDTFDASLKRKLKKDGFYNQKDMYIDLVTMLYGAKKYYENELPLLEPNYLKNVAKINNDINKMINDAENLCQKVILDYNNEINKFMTEHSIEISNMNNNISNDIKSILNSKNIINYRNDIINYCLGFGLVKSDWENFSIKIDSHKRGILLGKIKIKDFLDGDFEKELDNKIPNFHISNTFLIPIVFDYTKRNVITIQTEYNSSEILQNYIMKMMLNSYTDNLCVHICDPLGHGINFKYILSEINDYEKYKIFIYNSPEKIDELLKRINDIMDKNNVISNKYNSLYDYNDSNHEKFEEHLIVLNNLDDQIYDYLREKINNLLKASSKSGVCFIVCSKQFYDKENKRKYTFYEECNVLKIVDNSINLDNVSYQIVYDSNKEPHKVFLDNYKKNILLYRKQKEENIKLIEKNKKANEELMFNNMIKNTIDSLLAVKNIEDSTKGIRIPIFIDNVEKKPINFVIGGSYSTHTLITGGTGSGKSSLLHLIINAIIANYSPSDVNLWLIDYAGVEFKKYLDSIPPHVTLIALEKTEEFTYAFLDYLKDFFDKRQQIFKYENVTNLEEYRNKHGKDSMPRIVLVIDEFHNMTQHISHNLDMRNKLENALSEYRKFGLSCVFSNQTRSALNGLSETGFKQIRNRIAMLNDLNEIKETLDISNGNYSENDIYLMERMKVGDLWLKSGDNNGDRLISYFKSLYLDTEKRDAVIKTSKEKYTNYDIEKIIVNGLERIKFNNDFSMLHNGELILGKPTDFNKLCTLNMEYKYKNNIAVIVNDKILKYDINSAIILSAINNKYHLNYYSINEPIILNKSISYHNDMKDLVESIENIYKEYLRCKDNNDKAYIYNIWFDINELFDELEFYLDNLSFNNKEDPLGFDFLIKKEQDSVGIVDKLKLIIKYGPKFGIFNVFNYDNIASYDRNKIVKTDDINHLILSKTSKEDSFSSISKISSELDDNMAVLYFEKMRTIKFKPFRFD